MCMYLYFVYPGVIYRGDTIAIYEARYRPTLFYLRKRNSYAHKFKGKHARVLQFTRRRCYATL